MMGEGKKDRRPVQTPVPAQVSNEPSLIVKTCELFDQTFAEHSKSNPQLARKLSEFVDFKKDNPLAAFGKKDKGSHTTHGNYDREVPGIRHAGLNLDVSVWYTLSGAEKKVLKLYAVLSHDESGTGQPPSSARQKNMANRMANQAFK